MFDTRAVAVRDANGASARRACAGRSLPPRISTCRAVMDGGGFGTRVATGGGRSVEAAARAFNPKGCVLADRVRRGEARRIVASSIAALVLSRSAGYTGANLRVSASLTRKGTPLMISRSIVVAAALLVSACSKPDPGSASTTSAPVAQPTATTAAPVAPPPSVGQAPAPAAAPTAEDHSGPHTMPATPGMAPGMRMGGHPQDGGMGMGPMPHR